MVLNFTRKLLEPKRSPVTYLLGALNVLVFIFLVPNLSKFQDQVQKLVIDEAYLQVQGRLFAQLIEREPQLFSKTLKQMAVRSMHQDENSILNLAFLAFQNTEFMTNAEGYPFFGDKVAMRSWLEKFKEVRSLQKKDPSYNWGLSLGKHPPGNYFTYQFAHGSVEHLVFNLLWLLVFGALIEWMMGSSALILVYFTSGVGAALFYSLTPGFSTSPLIGASGAISGLIGYVVVLNQSKPYRIGSVPGWLIFLIFPLGDVYSWLGGIPEMGAVAFTAHVGGALTGAIMGWLTHYRVVVAD